MLEELGVSPGEVCRQAIEDLFQGRNDRDYVRVSIEEYLDKLESDWSIYGLSTSSTITSTEDGFRIVIVSNKQFLDSKPELIVETKSTPLVSEDLEEDDFDFDFEGDD